MEGGGSGEIARDKVARSPWILREMNGEGR
jgi:hypothetical protein